MGRKVVVRSVLVLGLVVVSLAALLVLLDGAGRQAYAASSQPASRDLSTRLAPPFGPAANPLAAPLLNGGGTPVITVCHTGCPYATVQGAVSAIPAGGVVKVAQGTYTDDDADNRVVYITKTLTLQGGYTTTNWSAPDPVAHPTYLDGESSNRVLWIVNGVSPTVEGFHIHAGSGNQGGGVYIDGGGATLQSNHIYNNAATSGGGVYVASGAPALINNFVYTNAATGSGGGVYISSGGPLLLHDTLYDNEAGARGGGLYIASGAVPTVRATIVVSNVASEGGGIYGASGVRHYNDVWGNDDGNYGGGALPSGDSISSDPLFVNPAGPDLHIRSTSPCRDQAPLAQEATVDYRGWMRPFGAQADIGAHEFYTGTCLAQIEGATRVYSTVQAAVDAAGAGDLVKVAGICRGVQSRTVGATILTQTVFINQSLILRGGYTVTNWTDSDPDAYPTTLDALGEGRVIYIADGAGSPIIEELRIVGGDARGLSAQSGVNGANKGGGIFNYGDSVTIRNNVIYNNTAANGGGIFNGDGSPTIQGNTIYSNSVALGYGGGVYIREYDSIIHDNWIYENEAGSGGGIYLGLDSGAHDIRGNRVYSNVANGTSGNEGQGGGIYIGAGEGVVEGNWIYANTARRRGGGAYAGGSSNIEDNWIYDNHVSGSDTVNFGGSGVYAGGASTIRGNEIYSNSAPDASGGGIHIYNGGVSVEQNTIHHNGAGKGGGIYVREETPSNPTIENNLVYTNTAATNGGGIAFGSGGSEGTVDGNTIYGNAAASNGGGGIYVDSGAGTVVIRNSIIVSNAGCGVQGDAETLVTYSDLWGNGGGSYGDGGVVAGTGTITENPQFEEPGVDFSLQTGSPCIGVGDPNNYPANDYDGRARPFGPTPDMGAYEFYTGDCFVQLDGATRVYTDVQAVVDLAAAGGLVKVAGVCQGVQPRAVGGETFTQTVYISQALTLRGGYTVSLGLEDGHWITPAYQTILDPSGAGRGVYITGTGAVTVAGFIVRNGSADIGGGVYFAAPLNPTVQNVIFHDNTAQYGGGLALTGGASRLYNNTFVANTATADGGGAYIAAGSSIISNNIVVSNTGDGIWAGAGVTPSMAYNDVGGNSGDDYGGSASAGATDFWVAPRFVDFSGKNFHLAVESPCIHAADPGTGLVWDLEGDPRPSGRGADVGADEAALYADLVLAPYSSKGGQPGSQTIHTHFLTNTGSISDTFHLTHSLAVTWNVDYTPVFTLAAGEVAEVLVAVSVPPSAVSSTLATVLLTATSSSNVTVYDVVSNTTLVDWNPDVDVTPVYTEYVNAGTVITYEHTLINSGNAPDSFEITYDDAYGWTAAVTWTNVTDLPSSGTATIWVRVEVPDTAPGGLIERTAISAASPESGVRQVVTDTTGVNYTTGDRYVAATGTDELNSCLVSGSPCRTVGHAVDQAVSGDTVKVAEGTYHEYDLTINKNITLRGGYYAGFSQWAPAEHESIVDAQGAGRVFYVFGAPTIEGFTITGGATAGSGGGVYIYSLGDPIIRGNNIFSNTATVNGGGIHNELGNSIIEQNKLAFNTAQRGAAFSSKAGTPGFWSNAIYDNVASADGGGVYVSGGAARIWHDTIYSNEADRGGGVYLAGGSSVVSNTIVVKNSAVITGGGIYKHTAASAALGYNDVWDNVNGDYVGVTAGAHSIATDPRFVNEGVRNFHLQPGDPAPCVNAGDATSVAEDFEGDPRTMGPAPDIGADERRRLGVELEPDGAKNGDPGVQVFYDHVVTNTGNYTDTFTISAASAWSVTTPDPVTIGAGKAANVQVAVSVPEDAVAYTVNTMVVTATSIHDPLTNDTAVDATTVNRHCGLEWKG